MRDLRRAVAERQVLERALAALVAVRAVERVVEEDELEDGVLAEARLLARLGGLDDHPVLCGERARRLQLREPLDLAETHAAGAERRAEPRLVAEDGDLDSGPSAVSTTPVPFGTWSSRPSIGDVTSSGALTRASGTASSPARGAL